MPSYFCNDSNNITWFKDSDDQFSLNNWIDRFELTCASPFIISSFSMFNFMGWALGSLFVP